MNEGNILLGLTLFYHPDGIHSHEERYPVTIVRIFPDSQFSGGRCVLFDVKFSDGTIKAVPSHTLTIGSKEELTLAILES
jgi:hypothetical protein